MVDCPSPWSQKLQWLHQQLLVTSKTLLKNHELRPPRPSKLVMSYMFYVNHLKRSKTIPILSYLIPTWSHFCKGFRPISIRMRFSIFLDNRQAQQDLVGFLPLPRKHLPKSNIWIVPWCFLQILNNHFNMLNTCLNEMPQKHHSKNMIKHLPTSPNFPQLPRLRVALGAQHRRLRRQLPRAEQLGSCPTGAGDVADLLGATEVAGPAASCEGLRKRLKPGIR